MNFQMASSFLCFLEFISHSISLPLDYGLVYALLQSNMYLINVMLPVTVLHRIAKHAGLYPLCPHRTETYPQPPTQKQILKLKLLPLNLSGNLHTDREITQQSPVWLPAPQNLWGLEPAWVLKAQAVGVWSNHRNPFSNRVIDTSLRLDPSWPNGAR